SDPRDQDQNSYPNKGKVSIAFVEFEERHGKSTSEYLDKLQKLQWDLPGVEIVVNQEVSGPPQAKPVTIEITGEDLEALLKTSDEVKKLVGKSGIKGLDNLKSDFVSNKPEIVFDIDRERVL